MFTIRKKLSEAEGTDPNTRYDESCECVQSTFDGGATWVDNPAADPRISVQFLNPGSDDKCSAAQGVANFVASFLDGAYSAFSVVGIASWAIQVGFFFTPLGIFYRVALLVADGLLGIGSITLQETFDSDTFDAIRDIAYCHLNDEGKFDDQAAFDAFGEQLQEDIGGSAFNIVMALMFNLYGWVGFSNAALEYAEVSDCSGASCYWCYHFADGSQLDAWTSEQWNGMGDTPANYSSGVWQSGQAGIGTGGNVVSYVHLRWEFSPPITINDAAAHSPTSVPNRTMWKDGDGSIFSGTQIWSPSGYTGGTQTVDSIDVLFWQTVNDLTPFVLDWIQLSGKDDQPFGDPNC